jgi:hypothetical protein
MHRLNFVYYTQPVAQSQVERATEMRSMAYSDGIEYHSNIGKTMHGG